MKTMLTDLENNLQMTIWLNPYGIIIKKQIIDTVLRQSTEFDASSISFPQALSWVCTHTFCFVANEIFISEN